jgi:hypothetical protein
MPKTLTSKEVAEQESHAASFPARLRIALHAETVERLCATIREFERHLDWALRQMREYVLSVEEECPPKVYDDWQAAEAAMRRFRGEE